ncbi:MAG: hypothetical protein WAV38_25900, partial [Xanthobacteraceae bacterium]
RGCFAHAVGDKVEAARTHETHAVRASVSAATPCLLSGVKQTSRGAFPMPLLTQSGHRRFRIAAVQTDP